MLTRGTSLIAALIGVALTSACSPFTFVNALVPDGEYRRTTDIPYASLKRQKLDVYVPLAAGDGAAKPVVIFFYGGGWAAGDRGEYLFVAEALTSQGFLAVIPD